ncbi:MAG TPA: SDR family NAD(P)-dependent oxidoreductase, partial [Nitrospinaceae bacterium]|nr:SDR family NAD(P)-dependent oxidoreductase [Nitrospinaceae bacterium]
MSTTKTVLVTGAGSGIGRAIAQRLSRNDYSLILLG